MPASDPINYADLERAYEDCARSDQMPSRMAGTLGSLRYIVERTPAQVPEHVQAFLDEHADDSDSLPIVVDEDGVRLL